MRRFIVRLVIVLVVVAVLLSAWIAGGRSLSMFVDSLHTVQIENQPVTNFALNDALVGMISINGIPMSTQSFDNRPASITLEIDAQGRFIITVDGKPMTLGPAIDPMEDHAGVLIRPEPEDHVIFSISRSLFSWPTPFEFNFMTGHSPSWKRHVYYRLFWQKADRRRLEMLWRYEQYFYSNDGWASAFMTREGSTGLMRANVTQ